jgi:hypothetical protein
MDWCAASAEARAVGVNNPNAANKTRAGNLIGFLWGTRVWNSGIRFTGGLRGGDLISPLEVIDHTRLSSGARSRDLKGHDNHQSIPIKRLLRLDQTRCASVWIGMSVGTKRRSARCVFRR